MLADRRKRSSIPWWFFISMLISLLLTIPNAALAQGVVSQVIGLDFGHVDLHPAGDTITIAAQDGPTDKPTANRSLVSGGGSGRISITSNEPCLVEVTYPGEVLLTSRGRTVTVRGFSSLSQTAAELPGGGVRRDLSIGGSLDLPGHAGQGAYSGTLTLQIHFF